MRASDVTDHSASLLQRSWPSWGRAGFSLSLVALFVFIVPVSAEATTVIPASEDAMARDAAAIVIGRVTGIAARSDLQARSIFTDVTVTVEEVLKGEVPLAEITLRQPGGIVGDLGSWIEGSPTFVLGERALLFLRPNRNGLLHVAHLYQGKFTIALDPATGEDYATREVPRGVRSPHLPNHGPAGGTTQAETQRLRDLTQRIRGHVARAPHPPAEQQRRLTLRPAEAPDTLLGTIQAAFTFLGPARWFEPDTGNPVAMKINSLGEPRASTNGFEQVRQAFQAWSSVSGASFFYADGGLTDAVGFQQDGVNAVSFGDPLGDLDPPVSCSGTLAAGGFFYTTSQSRTVNGTTFWRIREGDLVFNDGWSRCGFYENFANFAEVATHELGHVLGLDHSSDPSATMYYMAHFDGRGATLRPDDMDGLRAIYPGINLTITLAGSGSGTVTSTPGGIACGSDCAQGYASGVAVTLTVTPAAGSIFAGWSGDCTGTGGCTVTMNGVRSVTATFQRITSPDLLWHNGITGEVYVWYMNGASVSGGYLLGTVADTTWRLVGAGDFNGDGRPDLLWQNSVTGDVYIWYMSGTTVTGGTYVSRGADVAWKIVGTGDLNGDGRPDLIWQNSVTGDVYVWYMSGTTVTGGTYVSRGADVAWKIVGTGDFTGDGRPDLLWQNSVTGDVYIWYMSGTTVTGGTYVSRGADVAWKIVGTGDFTGDGHPDLLWQNSVTGQVYVWYMSGASVTAGRSFGTDTDTSWRVVGTGDLNTDGAPDLLWQNSVTGQVYVWYMSGGSVSGGQLLGTVADNAWRLVGAADFTP